MAFWMLKPVQGFSVQFYSFEVVMGTQVKVWSSPDFCLCGQCVISVTIPM